MTRLQKAFSHLFRIGTHFTAIENMRGRPDIVTLAKAVGNGHPVGIVITTDAIATSFYKTGVSYFNTVSNRS